MAAIAFGTAESKEFIHNYLEDRITEVDKKHTKEIQRLENQFAQSGEGMHNSADIMASIIEADAVQLEREKRISELLEKNYLKQKHDNKKLETRINQLGISMAEEKALRLKNGDRIQELIGTDPRSRCKELVVEPPLTADVTSRRVGAIATFSCHSGHTLHGLENISCGSDKQWNGEIPSCRKTRNGCPEIATGPNQRVEIITLQTLTFARFMCSRGYELQGKSTFYCHNNKWNIDQPTCEERRSFSRRLGDM